MAVVNILVGTMTGNAELVADAVRDRLVPAGFQVEILPMDKLTPAVFAREGVFLVCSSTYGQGDVPDNARDFFEALERERPDLSQIRYGVIGLGDSTYNDTYNNGGKRFDTLLAGLGATRIGQRMEHNASGGSFAEDDAAIWVEDWMQLIEGAASPA